MYPSVWNHVTYVRVCQSSVTLSCNVMQNVNLYTALHILAYWLICYIKAASLWFFENSTVNINILTLKCKMCSENAIIVIWSLLQ